MLRCLGLVVLLALPGCAHRRPPVDQATAARDLVRRLAEAIRGGDARAVTHLLGGAVGERQRQLKLAAGEERKAAADDLEAAARGEAEVSARLRLRGALGTQVVLADTPEGWRVDPDSLLLSAPTPLAAIEGLIQALERMETDPALALLTQPLRDSIVRASAERARGLREVLDRIPAHPGDQVSLQIDYGKTLFVLLRLEGGNWRVEDFN